MRRVRWAIALLALAVGLLGVPAGAAVADNGNHVIIGSQADYGTFGALLDVDLTVSCTGGTGLVEVTVNQDSPETGVPDATGTGFNAAVVCDGQPRSVGVTVIGVVYDPGKAYAVADVLSATGTAHAERQITIVVR